MTNPKGSPIWYELLTSDIDGAKPFYDAVIGWNASSSSDQPGMDYRAITTPDGGRVGGMTPLNAAMQAGGAKPAWLFYIGVDDVDATARTITEKGGSMLMQPFDIPNVGRMALAADRQGSPFYIMRGSSPEDSNAFDQMGVGKCSWNELNTTDQADANAFYADVFGWTYPETMPMGDAGDYMFIDAGGRQIGATMNSRTDGTPPGWVFYFRAADIDAAAEQVKSRGGTVHSGPMEVPGGDRIIVASDPVGAWFGVVAPGK